MKDDNNFDDFESFLQSETETHKMFPSDSVWSNVSKQIQPKKSWPALTIIASAIIITLGVATFFNYPPENLLEKLHSSIKNKINNKDIVSNLSTRKSAGALMLPSNVTSNSYENSIPKSSITLKKQAHNNSIISALHSTNLASITSSKQDVVHDNITDKRSDNLSFEKATLVATNELKAIDYPNLENFKLHGFNNKKKVSTLKKIDNRFEYEVYATPSISFRNLAEDEISKSSSRTINNQVSQKAGFGKELGFGVRCKISKDITLKTGVQFNIREYYIDAYKSSALATIGIFQNNTFDSINVVSKYSNGSGVGQTRLSNTLYQISIPLGLEWNVFSNKNIGLNIGASIQPTYSLNKNVYILSTDYKYYASGESLFRKWNINSSLSTNFTYTHNNSTFFIGPQVRYQHLPTYVDKYPIKEYRIDYGIRLGIIRSFNR